LPAEDAMRLARALRAARLPDESEAVERALSELRAPSIPQAPDDEIGSLLDALAGAARGGRAERATLARTADAANAPLYAPDRLQSEVLALARTLARAPEADLRPGGAAHASLTALHRTLGVVLQAGAGEGRPRRRTASA
jgi:hypothetical protein